MTRPPFIEKIDSIGNWDTSILINDLKNLVTATGSDWDSWSKHNIITATKYSTDPLTDGRGSSGGNINLTCNLGVSKTLEDRLWAFSGRKFQQSIDINHGDLHTLNPALHGTYMEQLYKKLVEVLGPIYMRIHNKHKVGLYWHRDVSLYEPGLYRYHIVLWTNPGHFLVYTPDELQWEKGVQPDQNSKNYQIYAQYLPVTGDCYRLATGYYVHGVSSIGVGWARNDEITSRCHIVVIPINPDNRYDTYLPL